MHQRIFTITVLLIAAIYCNYSYSQCHIDDWTALKALYESTNGDNWEDKEGWQQVKGDTPPLDCNLMSMDGIKLNSTGAKRVIDISLISNGLKGIIPPEISLLSELEELRLVFNELSGSIPASIGDLVKLVLLNLDFNQLSGPLPPSLGDLKNLKYLYLISNDITGSIPHQLGKLESITRLNLSNNQLTGTIPVELAEIKSFYVLNISGNQLTGSIPPEFGDASFLTLFTEYNNLSGCYDGNLLKLCDVVSDNPTYFVPLNIGNNFDATWQDFCETQAGLCKPINTCYARDWRALKEVYEKTDGDYWSNRSGWNTIIANREAPPENCNLSELHGVGINNIGRVDSVNLMANYLSGELPVDLAYLTDLRYLFLNNNQLSGEIPSEIPDFLNYLEVFSAACNQLSGELPYSLSFMPNLNLLCLSNNYFEGDISFDFHILWKLKYLYLAQNDLSGTIPANISRATNLQYIDLSHNRFSDSIPAALAKLTKLTSLILDNNEFIGSIPKSLGNLTELKNLEVNNNQLSGCYNISLLNLCEHLKLKIFTSNSYISTGNNFTNDWETFCETGICE